MKELFDHQKEAVEKCVMLSQSGDRMRGTVQMPTGTGKTLVQAEVVAQIANFERGGGFCIILVKSPRILLSNQLSEEYNSYFLENYQLEHDIDYFSILAHSGSANKEAPDTFDDIILDTSERLTDDEWYEKVDNFSDATSSGDEICAKINQAYEDDVPIIIYTTYHSNQKVIDIIRWEKTNADESDIIIDINDEAHYLVREDFSVNLNTYKPNLQLFFTATRRVSTSDSGLGMNNTERFGDVIYELAIRRSIEMGLMLPVRLMRITTDRRDINDKDVDKGLSQFVSKSFNELEERFPIPAKLLVATTGSTQIELFIKSKEYKQLRERNIHILTVHSKSELTTYNETVITRKEFQKKLKQIANSDQKMILMHYDILSEGIDIPGLTGALIMRNMNEAKFLQTVGRIVRIFRSAPEKKPYAMLYLPDISGIHEDMVENICSILSRLKEAGYMSKELVNEYIVNGIPSDEPDIVDSLEEEENNFSARAKNLQLYAIETDLIETLFKVDSWG